MFSWLDLENIVVVLFFLSLPPQRKKKVIFQIMKLREFIINRTPHLLRSGRLMCLLLFSKIYVHLSVEGYCYNHANVLILLLSFKGFESDDIYFFHVSIHIFYLFFDKQIKMLNYNQPAFKFG